MAEPRLRSGLVIEPAGAGSVVRDPISRRAFGFDEPQAVVLAALDGTRDARAIAVEVFGDPAAEPAIAGLLDRLQRLGLLDDQRDPDAIRRAQAAELRPRAAALRDRRVADSVRWAAAEIPLYHERIGALAERVHGVADLALLPTTTKQDVRDQFPHGLLARGHDLGDLLERGELQISTTSGSTGDRLEALGTLDLHESYVLFCRHPAMRSAGLGDQLKLAYFTTPLCSGAVCHRTSTYEERVFDGGKLLVLQSSERIMRMRKHELDRTVEELERFAPDVLQLDPVYGMALVRALQRNNLRIPRIPAIFSTYEFMSCIHRDALSEAFGVPIYQLYGASEINGIASFTCEHGRFHALAEAYHFEFLRNGAPVAPGEWGEVTATMLRGPYSRLVRYRLGDLATPIARCGCQFDDLVAFEIEGRIQDVLLTTQGEPVSTRQVDRLFEGTRWLDFYQFHQRDRTRFELLAVPRDGVDTLRDEQLFVERVREQFGADAQVSIGYVRELPISPSLKYPPTVNKSPRTYRLHD